MIFIKKSIARFLYMLGFEIRRKRDITVETDFRDSEMIHGLTRFRHLRTAVNSIIDVGAASGSWSLTAKKLWPDCNYLLFEPLVERKEELIHLCNVLPNFRFIQAAAGSTSEGELPFNVSPDLDGSGVSSGKVGDRIVSLTSISAAVESFKLTGPFIIKLDTHGYEMPILEGCASILDDVSLFVIECYGFEIAKNSLLFWQMCEHMNSLGFRLFDVVDVMRRPGDNAFWQCDAFFISKRHPLFQRKTYQE